MVATSCSSGRVSHSLGELSKGAWGAFQAEIFLVLFCFSQAEVSDDHSKVPKPGCRKLIEIKLFFGLRAFLLPLPLTLGVRSLHLVRAEYLQLLLWQS